MPEPASDQSNDWVKGAFKLAKEHPFDASWAGLCRLREYSSGVFILRNTEFSNGLSSNIDLLFKLGKDILSSLSGDEMQKLFDEYYDMHTWTEELQECPIKTTDGKTHEHYMRCGRCGIIRHGAFAEHSVYHYFTHDNGTITHKIAPPCKSHLPKDFHVRVRLVCSRYGTVYKNGFCPSCKPGQPRCFALTITCIAKIDTKNKTS